MLEAAVERLGRSVGCAGPVEVGQHVRGAMGQGPAETSELDQDVGDARAERLDNRLFAIECGVSATR